MVCDQCLNAAAFPHMVYCAHCLKPSRTVGKDAPVTAGHNHPRTPGERCHGAFRPAKSGHDICAAHGGCTCQHRPSGSWNHGRVN